MDDKKKLAAGRRLARYDANSRSECARSREWYAANREKKIAYSRKYYEENKEAVRQRQNENRRADRQSRRVGKATRIALLEAREIVKMMAGLDGTSQAHENED